MTDALRDALEQARLVAQWHDSMHSGPLVVLDWELGVLGELVEEALVLLARDRETIPIEVGPIVIIPEQTYERCSRICIHTDDCPMTTTTPGSA